MTINTYLYGIFIMWIGKPFSFYSAEFLVMQNVVLNL